MKIGIGVRRKVEPDNNPNKILRGRVGQGRQPVPHCEPRLDVWSGGQCVSRQPWSSEDPETGNGMVSYAGDVEVHTLLAVLESQAGKWGLSALGRAGAQRERCVQGQEGSSSAELSPRGWERPPGFCGWRAGPIPLKEKFWVGRTLGYSPHCSQTALPPSSWRKNQNEGSTVCAALTSGQPGRALRSLSWSLSHLLLQIGLLAKQSS